MGNALSKLLALTLAYHQPVDLLTGPKIDTSKALAWNNSKEFHHFFPRNYLKQRGEKLERINCLANYIMLTSSSNKAISASPPSKYLRKVAAEANLNLSAWLANNFISQEAYQAALADNFDAFVNLRAQNIHSVIMSRANWQ